MPQLDAKGVKVIILWKQIIEFNELIADWKKFELALFNIVQNAVKYNSRGGVIAIILSLFSIEDLMLQAEIIDTGIGISEQRQKMLFQPFMELMTKQSFD